MTIQTVCDVVIAKAYLFCLALGQEIGCCWRSWELLITFSLHSGWSPWNLKKCSFMSWALKGVWRYNFRSGNNPVPLAYWTRWAMQLTLQSPKHRPFFDPHQFCPYCQTSAVCLFTEFADLSCSILLPTVCSSAEAPQPPTRHQSPFKLGPLFIN